MSGKNELYIFSFTFEVIFAVNAFFILKFKNSILIVFLKFVHTYKNVDYQYTEAKKSCLQIMCFYKCIFILKPESHVITITDC